MVHFGKQALVSYPVSLKNNLLQSIEIEVFTGGGSNPATPTTKNRIYSL